MKVSHRQIKFAAIEKRSFCPHFSVRTCGPGRRSHRCATRRSPFNPDHSDMPEYDNDQLGRLRAALLDHPIYTHVERFSIAANLIWR